MVSGVAGFFNSLLGQQACPREEGGQFFVVSLCYVDETTGLLYVQRYVMGNEW